MFNKLIFNYLKTINHRFKEIAILALLLIATSCSSVKQLALAIDTSEILRDSPVFSRHFTGFSLYDLDEGKTIASHNSDLLFTPASNTKLLTMYAALKSFKDSIPGILYYKDDQEVTVQAIGDPTFLNPTFPSQPIYDFLSAQSKVEVLPNKQTISPYGPGWAWDDYIYSYQAQISWWPIYGNVVHLKKTDSAFTTNPAFFEPYIDLIVDDTRQKRADRAYHFNKFTAYIPDDTTAFETFIPFETSNGLILELLKDTLKVEVRFAQGNTVPKDTLFSYPLDSVLARMMKPSDNFLAEQLFLMSSWQNNFDSSKEFRKYVLDVWLSELGKMVWVDGSGLSRYNLISPTDQVRLLKKCVDEFGWERIASILPTGGEGTLKDLYLSDENFIFAKTGTLSNNHNLSGMLLTKSGKRLLFSLMNNHYTRSNEEIKKAMEAFIVQVREAY